MLRESSWKKTSSLSFQKKLEESVGKPLKLRLNDNRSTMLSVRFEPDHTRVSMHRMFLEAPQEVMEELATYLKSKKRGLTPSIKAYIEDNLPKLSYQTDKAKLITKGAVYDLEEIYDRVNKQFFNNELKLSITWFGTGKKTRASRVNFGLYYDTTKLIKINRLLDNKAYPDFVVEYVVYHEMLHAVYPTYLNENGRRVVHSPIFKRMEKKFPRFFEAQDWIKKHYTHGDL
jgi:hypothetical protein